ncbi:hypothetical protein TNCV_1675601 [Trichonephila clavipes]|nr:hypothetical protein TNCV_1675601 [Trichonephila clavipes]
MDTLTKDHNMYRACQHIVPYLLNEDQSADEVKSASQAELKDRTKNRFQKCFDDLNKPWQKCIVTQRSHFEAGCVVPGSLGQALKGSRGYHKDSDLLSNPWSETLSFGARWRCSQ